MSRLQNKADKLYDRDLQEPRKIFGNVEGLSPDVSEKVELLIDGSELSYELVDRVSRRGQATSFEVDRSGPGPSHVGFWNGNPGYLTFAMDELLRTASHGSARILTFEDVLKYKDQIEEIELKKDGIYQVNSVILFPFTLIDQPAWWEVRSAVKKAFQSEYGWEFRRWGDEIIPKIFSGLVYEKSGKAGWGPFKRDNLVLKLTEDSRVLEAPDFLMDYAHRFKYEDGKIIGGHWADDSEGTWLRGLQIPSKCCEVGGSSYGSVLARGANFIYLNGDKELVFSCRPYKRHSGNLIVRDEESLEKRVVVNQ